MIEDLLLKLAAMLDADADNEGGIQFDLNFIARPSIGKFVESWKPSMTCNTTGCALGIAALSGEFEGLTYLITDNLRMQLKYKDVFHTFAAAANHLFDIEYYIASALFSPNYYNSSERTGARGERAVAKRIRDLVDRGHLKDYCYELNCFKDKILPAPSDD